MDRANSLLKLVRYRDPESSEYLYFWTDNQDGVNVHVSPMFDNQEDAEVWFKELMEKVKNACTYRPLY
jgi:hypothetical protein